MEEQKYSVGDVIKYDNGKGVIKTGKIGYIEEDGTEFVVTCEGGWTLNRKTTEHIKELLGENAKWSETWWLVPRVKVMGKIEDADAQGK